MNSKNRLRATYVAIIKDMKQDVSTRRSLSTAGYKIFAIHNYSLCLRKLPNLSFISNHKAYLGDVQSLKLSTNTCYIKCTV